MPRFPAPADATATNSESSGAQHTDCHDVISDALVLDVQLVPSGLVMTRLPVPFDATTTNNESSGAQHTDCHAIALAAVLFVHTIPSELFMT